MSKINIFLCSPRRNGVTDHLAGYFSQGAIAGGVSPAIHALRNYTIKPCQGCGYCASAPNECIFSDGAGELFSILQNSKLTVFASPIYFYATPAHFKAFIDRSQPFWEKYRNGLAPCEEHFAIPVLAAGRPAGEKLFTSTLRTMAWFLKSFNIKIVRPQTYRGLDAPADITEEIGSGLYELGFSLASRLIC